MTEISSASSHRKASILGISHAMLDKVDTVLDTMLPPPIDDAQNPVSPALLRATALRPGRLLARAPLQAQARPLRRALR
jgi:hypothetical protein